MNTIRISGLFIYPIKSCGKVPVDEAKLVAGGLELDRRYMVVDETGRFISGRTHSALLQIAVSLQPGGTITASHPTMAAPLHLAAAGTTGARTEEVFVWRDQTWAEISDAGTAWFSEYLGEKVKLVYLPEDRLRQINRAYADEGNLVSFADGFPLLLTSENSLQDLNSKMKVPLPMERFRPNVVIEGADAYAEDRWAGLMLNGVPFDAPKLCDRCVITTVDPASLAKGVEPLKTLATYRRWGGAVWFGSNLIARGAGTLRVGGGVSVLAERAHPREANGG